MDKILYAGFAVAVLALAGTIWMIVKNRSEGLSLVCIREDWMTAVMGLMVLVLGVWFLWLKLSDGTVAGTDANSYWFVAGLGLACNLMGDFMMLYATVKRIELYDDRVESISAFGKVAALGWEEIVEVKKPTMGRSIRLTGKDGTVISVSGSNKGCDEFVDFARSKVKSSQRGNLLKHVENRLRGK